MKKTSQKQIEANRQNGKKGGVKTEAGKEIAKYNAVKHGILKEAVSDYEKEYYEDTAVSLYAQFQPVGVFEKMLVDRIGVYYLKLLRVSKAENEYIKSKLNPRKVIVKEFISRIELSETIVQDEGYTPVINTDSIDKLSTSYLRYEISIENRLYKAVHELQRVQSIRNGEKPPHTLDTDENDEQ